MIIRFFILTLFMNLIFSTCDKGCLKCGSNNECILCDSLSGYKKENLNCVKISQKNCEKINLEGNCLFCINDTFIDASTQKCVAVQNPIENCKYYLSNQSCSYCKNSYYMENGQCLKIPSEIQNCLNYQNFNTCSECLENYVLSLDQKSCYMIPLIPNCKSYSYLQCMSCDQGYQLDHNFYYTQTFQFEDNSDLENINDTLILHQNNLSPISKKHICQQTLAQNCQTYENFKKCKTCKLNYYMDGDGICREFPQEQIVNCKTYLTEQECSECQEGYFLENFQKCSPIQIIANCKVYDNSKNISYCKKCDLNYYSEGQKCVQRQLSLSIDNCNLQKNDKDQCEQCIQNYLLTNDFLKCLPIIENCKVHQISATDKDSLNHVCEQCKDQFYLNQDTLKCVEGTIKNCQVYDRVKNECQSCQNGFYLEMQECKKHTEIENCQNYSQSIKDQCQECNYYTQRFVQINQCSATSKVPNCKKYLNQQQCQSCQQEYYLKDNSCLQIPKELNCRTYNGTSCEHCNDNYILLNGKCLNGFSSMLQNCYQNNISNQSLSPISFGGVQCHVCSEGFIAMDYKLDYFCLENIFLENPIQNCLKYDQNNNCIQCEQDFYLKEQECVKQCVQTSKNVILELNQQKNQYFIKNLNSCGLKIGNCIQQSITSKKEQVNYECSKCDDKAIQIIDPKSETFVLFNEAIINQTSIINNPLNEFQILQCMIKENTQIKGQINLDLKSVKDCEYYYLVNQNQYGCFKCKFGFRGIIKKDDTDLIGFIDSCDSNLECDTTVKFQGLVGQFEKFVSCNECLNKSKKLFIPFAWDQENNYPNSLKPYQLNSQIEPYSQFCSSLESQLFQIEEQKFKLPQNCAFYGYNIDSDKDASSSSTTFQQGGDLKKMQIICLACLPKFSPVYFQEKQQFPVQCNEIQNCKQSNWLNSCSECEKGHSYLQSSDKTIQYDKCIKNTINQSCLVLNIDDPLKPFCYKCQRGFFINKDGLCEQTVAPNCLDENINFIDFFELKNLKFALWLNNTGCSKCDKNFFLKQFETISPICTQSSYVRYQNYLSNTKFILNCRNYEAVFEIKCSICQTGYVLSTDQKFCFNGLNLKNCQTALNSTFCQVCIKEYISINGKCQQKSLSNCSKYLEDPNQNQQKCVSCVDQYFLQNGQCLEGNITGCLQYEDNNKNKCLRCKQFFHLMQKESFSYCYPHNINLNCQEFSDEFSDFKLNCTQCQDGYFLEQLQNQKDICLSFNTIIGCEKYAKIIVEDKLQYQCLKCVEGFYYDQYKCKKRLKISQAVQEYNPGYDEALSCLPGYYLNYENQCQANPTGIQGCTIYNSKSICAGCKQYYYLVNNQCIFVEENQRLNNCLFYENLKSCKGCEDGFFALKGQCIRVEALNCNTYKDNKNCSSCKPGYGLKQVNENINCVIVNQPNCLYYASMYPWSCLKCDKNFYPNQEGSCSQIIDQIANCIYYDSLFTCIQCEKGSVLAEDKKSCNFEFSSFQDKNCLSYRKLKQPICSFCDQGYYFLGEKCVMCNQYTVTSGCFSCDPYDQSKCLLCKPGYFQNSQNECVKEILEIDQDEVNEELKTLVLIKIFKLLFLILI